MPQYTTHAIILAAGFGSRLQPEEGHKILARVGGRPMLDYHLDNFGRLGVTDITVVTGYESEALMEQLEQWSVPRKIELHAAYNPDFESGNGQSVLAGVDAARDQLGDGATPFWLTMSDHLFDPAIFDRLAESWEPSDDTGVMLAVDYKLDTIFDMPDANKLRVNDGELEAIGKELEDFDRVDVGLFWCGEPFVEALRAELDERGDCSTSDAMRRLAAKNQAEYWDVGEALWQDVDTPEARAHAESLRLGS
ncbi:MAG: NTP transferase domain-containing protein [Myxococcota bacterium]